MCPISLRNWHAYISKYGPSQTWFAFKSDVTLWAQEDVLVLCEHWFTRLARHFRCNKNTRDPFIPFKKLIISSSEQVVKSNVKVNYSIILLFKAEEYKDYSISNHMLCLRDDLFILL